MWVRCDLTPSTRPCIPVLLLKPAGPYFVTHACQIQNVKLHDTNWASKFVIICIYIFSDVGHEPSRTWLPDVHTSHYRSRSDVLRSQVSASTLHVHTFHNSIVSRRIQADAWRVRMSWSVLRELKFNFYVHQQISLANLTFYIVTGVHHAMTRSKLWQVEQMM